MKKILALVLVLSLFAALAACTQVTRISIDSPAEIKLCHTTEDSISIEMMAEGTIGTLAVTYALANNEK